MRFIFAFALFSLAGILQAPGQPAPVKMPPPMPTIPSHPPAPDKPAQAPSMMMSVPPRIGTGTPPKQTVSQKEAVTLFVDLCASAPPDLQRIKAYAEKQGWQAMSPPPPASAKLPENIEENWLLSADRKIFLIFSDRKMETVRMITCNVRILEADPAAVASELGQQLKSVGYKTPASGISHARLSFATDMNAATKGIELSTTFSASIEEKKTEEKK